MSSPSVPTAAGPGGIRLAGSLCSGGSDGGGGGSRKRLGGRMAAILVLRFEHRGGGSRGSHSSRELGLKCLIQGVDGVGRSERLQK